MIEQVIDDTLGNLGLPIFFIHKPDNYKASDYITWNFTTYEDWHSNNRAECDEYFVTINYATNTSKNVLPNSRKIEQTLKNSEHFMGVKNQGTMYNKDTQEFITAISLYYYEFN